MTVLPKIAAKNPAAIDLEEGKDYWFCTCGLSEKQPFCDGTHKGSGYKSMKFTAEKTGKSWLCQCKQSKNFPFCDGAHKEI